MRRRTSEMLWNDFCTTSRSWLSAAKHGVLANGVPDLGGDNRTDTWLSSSGVGESPFEFIPLSFWAVLRCSMSLKTVEVVDKEGVPQAIANGDGKPDSAIRTRYKHKKTPLAIWGVPRPLTPKEGGM
jgi:hypothetical protein